MSQYGSIKKVVLALLAVVVFMPGLSSGAMLRLGDFAGAPGRTTHAWLRVDDAAGLASIQFQINYDRNLLTFISATNQTGTLGAQFDLDVEPGDGLVIIRLFRDTSLDSGSGDLLTMRFGVNTGAEEGMSAALVLAETDLVNQYGADLRWNTSVLTEDATFFVSAETSSDLLFVRNAGFGGTITGDDSGFYPAGRQITISAAASEYFDFAGWEGDFEGDPTNPNLQIILSRPREVIAKFSPHVTESTQTPHWWLAGFGYTEDFDSAAYEDLMGKGMKLWEEYIAGTDPLTPSDRFLVDSVAKQNQYASFRFLARMGRRYSISYLDRLSDHEWLILDGFTNIIGTDVIVHVEDTNSVNEVMRFYRIDVELDGSGP